MQSAGIMSCRLEGFAVLPSGRQSIGLISQEFNIRNTMIDSASIVLGPIGETHPGEILQEYIDSYCWSEVDLSRRTGISAETISEICSGKIPISRDTAQALEEVFPRPARLWLNLQRQYDEAVARKSRGMH